MAEQGLNAALCYENPDPKNYISMVPTSAHTGEGIGNLMALLVKLSQTLLAKRLAFSEELQVGVLFKRHNFGISLLHFTNTGSHRDRYIIDQYFRQRY